MTAKKKNMQTGKFEGAGIWLKSFAFGGDKWRSMATLIALQAAAVFLIGAAIFSAMFGLLVGIFSTSYQWHVFYKTTWALIWRYTPLLNSNRPIDFANLDGKFIEGVHAPALIKHVFSTPELASHYQFVAGLAAVSLVISVVAVFYIARYFKEKGDRDQRDEFLRGQKRVTSDDMVEMVVRPTAEKEKFNGKPSPITLGGVPIPEKKLARNIGCFGSMGAAKTVNILQIIEDARAWGKKMVIYDPYGEFSEKFFREGVDFLLNPVDARGEDWSIFAELRKVTDAAMVSGYFVAANEGDKDASFTEAAKILIEDLFIIVRKMGGTMADVRNIVTQAPLPVMFKLLKDNNANSCGTLNPDNVRTSESIRFSLVAQEAVRFFAFYDKMNAKFSVRDFIRREDDACLFLTSNKTMHNVCKPFISAWIELAYIEAMSMELTRDVRMLFILDELASLQKLNVLKTALTEARKFGVVTVIGLQEAALLMELYGENWARAMIGNLGNLLVLRTAESKSAEWLADILGKEELDEVNESASLGVDGGRDGFSLSSKRAEYHIVNYTEIMNAEDGYGWVKLAGAYPVADVVTEWKNRPDVFKGFVERAGLDLPTPTPTAQDREYLAKITSMDSEEDSKDTASSDLPFDSAPTASPASEPEKPSAVTTSANKKADESFEGFL